MEIDEYQAFVAMGLFLDEFSKRTHGDFVTLLADIRLERDGWPLDPAAWSDWMRSLELVVGRGVTRPKSDPPR